MSQDGDDPSGKPPGRPAPPQTIAGLPPPRAVPPPRSGPTPYRSSQPAIPHEAPPYTAPPSAQPHPSPDAPHEQAPPEQTRPPYAPQQHAPPGQPPYAQPHPSPHAPHEQAPHEQAPPPYVPPQQHAQPPYAQPPHQPPYGPPATSPPMLEMGQPFTTPLPDAIPQAQVVGGAAGANRAPDSNPIQQLAALVEDVPGRFINFLKISTKRAFRLRIEPTEVLPEERAALARANPPIVEENQQAFLAWRRSVLFLVATLLVPLSIIGIIDSFTGHKVAPAVRYVKLLPALAETAFCAICWLQLRRWAEWRKQRRWLFIGWLLFMMTPFLVFIYPLKASFVGIGRSVSVAQLQELGWAGAYNKAVAPFAFAMIAMFQLAPKVISLMPGLIRSSMVIKLLFPGSAAPGWLIVMSAPLYAMIAYALLIIPYQFTGEPWFIVGILLIVVAQILVARSGFRLARPLSQDEAMEHIKSVRKIYMVLLVTALLCITGGLGVLAKVLSLKWTSILSTLLKFESNVLILTIIGADLVVTNLDRARHYTAGKEAVEEETEEKIAAFVGLNASAPPP